MLQPSLFRDTPSILRRSFLGIAMIVVLSGVGFRIASAFVPPPLDIETPSDLLSTSSRIVTIEGKTTPGATVTINGREYAPDASGSFSTDVVLLPGVNTIEIEARRRHSRSARVERRVYVHRADAPLARAR